MKYASQARDHRNYCERHKKKGGPPYPSDYGAAHVLPHNGPAAADPEHEKYEGNRNYSIDHCRIYQGLDGICPGDLEHHACKGCSSDNGIETWRISGLFG